MPGLSLPNYQQVTDAIDIQGNVATALATSAVAAQTAALLDGLYDVWGSQDTYIAVETGAASVTTANGYLVRNGNTITVVVRAGSKISAIAAGAGTLTYEKVG